MSLFSSRRMPMKSVLPAYKYIDKSVNSLKALTLAPYELSVSTGYVRFDKRFSNAQQFIDAADKIMYETKRSAHRDFDALKSA